MLSPPRKKPSVYDVLLLESARQLREAGFPVLNPRDISDRSLFGEDRVFTAEVALHMAWIQHKRDVTKQRKKK